jgi:hypothetical protein
MKLPIFISAVLLTLAIPLIGHAEQETEDLFASVVVLPAFKIDVDNNYLDFGLVKPGETVTLKPQGYYNTIKCVSNKARQYYVKLHILGDILGPRGTKIPPESFKWRVYQTSGSRGAKEGWHQFSNQPVIIYTSAGDDETGSRNLIRLQYKLDLPAYASGGHYSLKVAYLLTEEE